MPTEGIQKKVLGVLADSCRHMVVYALEKETHDDCVVYALATISIRQIYMSWKKELLNIILFTLKDDLRCQSCRNVRRDCVYIER